jgi:hypothetical protein
MNGAKSQTPEDQRRISNASTVVRGDTVLPANSRTSLPRAFELLLHIFLNRQTGIRTGKAPPCEAAKRMNHAPGAEEMALRRRMVRTSPPIENKWFLRVV